MSFQHFTSTCTALENTYEVGCLHLEPDFPDKELLLCCREIKSRYEDICDDASDAVYSDKRLAVTCCVVLACGFVKELIKIKKITWLPAAAGFIVVGMMGGSLISYATNFDFQFDEELFLRVLIPPICFYSSLTIDKPAFRSYIGPILTFALAGTLLSSLVAAGIMKAGGELLSCSEEDNGCEFPNGLPWPEAIAFGALISSVDPVAVLAVLNELGVSSTEPLYILIFGESLLNDGVAVVLFDTVLHFFKDDNLVDMGDIARAVLWFLAVFLGSSLFGFFNGLACNFFFRRMNKRMSSSVEVLSFFIWSRKNNLFLH